MPPRKVVQVNIDWVPGVYRSDVFVYKRHYTTHSEEWGDWSIVVDFTITGNTMASFLVYENAPQHLLVPGFEFGLYEGPRRVGVATVMKKYIGLLMGNNTMGEIRAAYIDRLLTLSSDDQRKEVEQLILDLMDWHEQTDEEKFYVDLHDAYKALK